MSDLFRKAEKRREDTRIDWHRLKQLDLEFLKQENLNISKHVDIKDKS